MKTSLLRILRGLARFLDHFQRTRMPPVLLACAMLCACSTVHPVTSISTAVVSNHVERAAAYTDSAAASVAKSATSAAKAHEAIQAAQRDVRDIKDNHNAVASLQNHLALAQQVNDDTQKEAESAKAELKQAKAESDQTASALMDLQHNAEALANQEAQAVKDKQAAVQRQKEIQADRDKIAGRLDTIAWVLAVVSGLLAWSLLSHCTRSVDDVAPWIGIGVPIFGGLFVGGSVFVYLRFLL